jgi:rhamnopyranosyl-N-acetylglucosaminyl-diphospho-decaprenol beta-1,3/1,4-galactofuranosyltransferase
MKIIAIVVTYNRLSLLKKCLQAIAYQTRLPDEVIIINNGSTDGTAAYLATQSHLYFTQENEGGAAGFSTGIKKAYEREADWIWLMDDDTLPQPDALAQLLTTLALLKEHQHKIGFLSSEVQWTDGSLHKMNRTWPVRSKEAQAEFLFAAEKNIPLIRYGTFVSMLLSAAAVEKTGLPIKDFFIWCDDLEYSKRIISKGLAGLAVPTSIVIHNTPMNHESSVFRDPGKDLWKYRYGLRNELYTKRQHEGRKAFWSTWMYRQFIWPILIVKDRKSHRRAYIMVVWQSNFASLFFHPKVENVHSRSSIKNDPASTDKKDHSITLNAFLYIIELWPNVELISVC